MANQFVAYQDERHGLGAWVAEQVAVSLFRYGSWTDEKGAPALDDEGRPLDTTRRPAPAQNFASSYGMSLSAPGAAASLAERPAPAADEKLNFAYRTWTSPRTSAEATFAAVISQQAQVGVVPLYDNDLSFNKDTLAALLDFPQTKAIREYVAESNYVLAAPTDLIHEIEQAGFTDSFSQSGSSASFQWNREKQQRYLRRVTQVYASADAMRHCAPAIEGLRARGIDVQLVPDGVDVYREGLRLAAGLLDPKRKIETHFSGAEHKRVSKTYGGNHTKPVVAVLLSGDKAMRPDGYSFDSDYVVLEAEMAGADRIRTSFVALTKKPAKSGPVALVAPSASTELSALEKHFDVPAKKARTPKADHRAHYPIPGDGSWPALKPKEAPALVRALYSFDTVGAGVGDYAKVLSALAEAGYSFQTTTLDGRTGHPMVVAIDVPAGQVMGLKPVLKILMKQKNVKRLADFPALRAMVPEAIRPKGSGTGSRVGAALVGIGVIVAGLVAYGVLAG